MAMGEGVVQRMDLLFMLILTLILGIDGQCPSNPKGRTAIYQSSTSKATKSCFEFIDKELPQPAAKSLCHESGGKLVNIPDKETQDWLRNYITTEPEWSAETTFWLGLEKSRDTWVWDKTNGSTAVSEVKYTNWEPNEPDLSEGRDCVIFSSQTSFMWRASSCNWWPMEYYAICQYDGAFGIFATKTNLIVFVTVLVLVVILVFAGISLLYCYKKRRNLRRQLQYASDSPEIEKKQINTENSIEDIDSLTMTEEAPPPYGRADLNINFLNNSEWNNSKIKEKNIKFLNRSQSEPAETHRPPPPFSLASAPVMEETPEGLLTESSPFYPSVHHSLNDLS